jgi:hypothetical protein
MKYRENMWSVLVHKFLRKEVQQTTRIHGKETPGLLILPRLENGYTVEPLITYTLINGHLQQRTKILFPESPP